MSAALCRGCARPSSNHRPRWGREGFADAETRAESRAISALLARFEVVAGRQSRIVTLRFSAFEPQLAADVVNTLAGLHVERDMEFRYTTSRNASQWLEQRIAEQRRKLEASERALQTYREEHGAAGIADRQNIIVRELENLHAAATAATLARVESEARYRDLQEAQDDAEALGRFPEILRNEVIQEQRLIVAGLRRERARLGESLGPRHPDMIAIESSLGDAEDRLRNEVLAVVDSLRIEFEVASSRERELAAELDRQTASALALDRTGIEYNVMLRGAESDRSLYESLLRRAAETGVTGELETSNVRVLDTAETPVRPARPRRQLILLLGLLGGSMLGVGLVFAMEFVDDRIRTPDDMRTHLKAPYLGMIPQSEVEAPSGDDRPLLGAREPQLLLGGGAPAGFTEAIRSVRTNLIFSSADEGSRAVLVTSAAPSEGKSCISANLAIALAQLGRKTLLVDADLRRPHQHSLFEVGLEPGLSNLLVGDANEAAAVKETSVPGLSLITAGKIPPNPADLIASDPFARAARIVPFAFRLDRAGHDAGPSRDGRAAGRPRGRQGAVRRRQRSDVAPGCGRRDREGRGVRSRRARRGAQQGEVRTPPLLLLAVLPPRLQPLLQLVPGRLTTATARRGR